MYTFLAGNKKGGLIQPPSETSFWFLQLLGTAVTLTDPPPRVTRERAPRARKELPAFPCTELRCSHPAKPMAANELLEAHERERQQYRQEIDSLTKAVDSVRSGSLAKLKDERDRYFMPPRQGSNPVLPRHTLTEDPRGSSSCCSPV